MPKLFEIRGTNAPPPERTGGKPKALRRRERPDVPRPAVKRRLASTSDRAQADGDGR